MKKTLVSLILCLVMLLPMCLTGCGGGLLLGDSTATKAATITITTICEEGTTQEAITLVQNAINSITENKYNTHVVLRMMTADAYEEYLFSKSEKNYHNNVGAVDDEEIPDEKTSDNSNDENPEIIEDETGRYTFSANGDKLSIDEYGHTHVVYPEAGEDQLDIVLVNSVSMYDRLVEGYKEDVGDGLTLNHPYLVSVGSKAGVPDYSTDALVEKYVPSYNVSARFALNLPGQSYAVPNYTYLGSYRYIVINKELFDKYQYDSAAIDSVDDLAPFVADLLENGEDVTPIYSYAGFNWQSYFGEDSMLSYEVKNDYGTGDGLSSTPSVIYSNSSYQQELKLLRDISKAGYTWSEDENISVDSIDKPFGFAVVRGDSTIPETYKDDYYVVTMERPQLTNEIYEGMYGISSFCVYPKRAVEILSLLYTSEEISNLLAYGVEGAHYELSSDGMVTARSSDYRMNPRYVGNMFLLRQNDEMDEEMLKYSNNNWELAKLQNRGYVISILCGFEVKVDDEIQGMMDSIAAESEKYRKKLADYDKLVEEGTIEDDYVAYIKSLGDEISSSELVKSVNSNSGTNNTPYKQYFAYFMARYQKEG